MAQCPIGAPLKAGQCRNVPEVSFLESAQGPHFQQGPHFRAALLDKFWRACGSIKALRYVTSILPMKYGVRFARWRLRTTPRRHDVPRRRYPTTLRCVVMPRYPTTSRRHDVPRRRYPTTLRCHDVSRSRRPRRRYYTTSWIRCSF